MKTRLAALFLFLAALLAPLLAPNLGAQDQVNIPLALRYDLDAAGGGTFANAVYVKTTGRNQGAGLIETSGSSTTVTAYTGNTTAFARLVVGDVIEAGGLQRAIVAKASAISVTVDTAVDWSAGSGLDFVWYHHEVGTGPNAGWINVSGFSNRLITFQGTNLEGDGNDVDVIWECKSSVVGAGPNQIYPDNAAAVDGTRIVSTVYEAAEGVNATRAAAIPYPLDRCRVGMAWNTADDGVDTGADRELIHIIFTGYAVQ